MKLAYLVGLPPNEVPSVEIARGDLVEVVPASYGVLSRAFNFWSGPGRAGDHTEGSTAPSSQNFYENASRHVAPSHDDLTLTSFHHISCLSQVQEATAGKLSVSERECRYLSALSPSYQARLR